MAAIRHTLQRELFNERDQQLLRVLHVTESEAAFGRRKRSFFLCIAVASQPPAVVYLYLIRKGDKGYSIKREWALRELQLVDGRNPRKAIPEIELMLDKQYAFEATNINDKEPFIRHLWKLCDRHLPSHKVEFVNVSLPVDEFLYQTLHTDESSGSGATAAEESTSGQGNAAEFRMVGQREEAEFRALLTDCDVTVAEAHRLAAILAKQLADLDGANLDAILGAETDIQSLMTGLDDAIAKADLLDNRLSSYESVLADVRESVELMEEKDGLNATLIANQSRLLQGLEEFLDSIATSEEDRVTLTEARLGDPRAISQCTHAAISLLRAQNACRTAGPTHQRMRSFRERSEAIEALTTTFAERLTTQLTSLFARLGEIQMNEKSPTSPPVHRSVHTALSPYGDLVSWAKSAHTDAYKMIVQKYTQSISPVYASEMRSYFDSLARLVGLPAQQHRRASMRRGDTLRGSVSSAVEQKDGGGLSSEEFTKLAKRIVSELEPVIGGEQKFCTRFFHLSITQVISDATSAGSNDSGQSPEKRLEKQCADEVRAILRPMFHCVEEEFSNFLDICDSPSYTLVLFGCLSSHVLSYNDGSSYASWLFANVLVKLKRRFDAFVESQVESLGEYRLAKRTRVGILPFVERLESLLRDSSQASATSTRRTEVERWQSRLVTAVVHAVDRVAQDPNSKAPPEVVRMENYHRMFSILSSVKVESLVPLRKEAKALYQKGLDEYVLNYMGRPMEKMSVFFDDIDAAIAAGLKPEEVGYQMRFSRQELERLIREYPSKEVYKGLQALYEKGAKHLCEEESLFQVVWHRMQEEFIKQYKHYESIIAQCYPNTQIRFEFTIQDILSHFIEIAKQHN